VCGGANNQLETELDGELLHRRGVVYCPDYVVNSGGVISAESELLKAPRARAESVARRVGETVRRVLELSQRDNIPTSVAADRLAEARLEAIAAVHRPYIAQDTRGHRALLP
jgi:leucine dehydrogenase